MKLPTKQDFDKFYFLTGRYAFKKMFFEMTTPDDRKRYKPIFTLKPYAYKGLPSAYEIYMSSVDEWDAAQKLAPTMRIWEQMLGSHWFMYGDPTTSHDGVAVWREHMKARDNSLAKQLLLGKVKEGDVTSAKAIIAENNKKPVKKAKKRTKVENTQIAMIKDFKKKIGPKVQ